MATALGTLAALPSFALSLQNVAYGLLWLLLAPIVVTIAFVISAHILRLMPRDEAEP
ncbi:MAG: hypothetical protein JHC95_15510 [Solirubrobacteraceae bacterium]|nr:hypothetical protein [Solirubrobacteraceae bacterium]